MGFSISKALAGQQQPETAKRPMLSAAAQRYQDALSTPATANDAGLLSKLKAALTPSDERSLREVAADQLREQATRDLKNPAKRDDAEMTLGLLERGELPTADGLVRIDTGEQVRAPLPPPGWKPR